MANANVEGRAALVTGASSGIGFALAEMLVEEGFALTVVSRRPEKLTEAADRLRAKGGEVAEYAVNLVADEGMIGAVAAHRERYGRLDVLVNNAGIGIESDSLNVKQSHVEMQINLNFRSVIVAYRESLDLLQAAVAKTGTAVVINVASLTGHFPDPILPIYSSAKAAVIAYTGSMNALLGPQGIRSTAISPGSVDTPLMAVVQESGRMTAEEMIPTADIAEAARMLLRLSPRSVINEIPISRPAMESVRV